MDTIGLGLIGPCYMGKAHALAYRHAQRLICDGAINYPLVNFVRRRVTR